MYVLLTKQVLRTAECTLAVKKTERGVLFWGGGDLKLERTLSKTLIIIQFFNLQNYTFRPLLCLLRVFFFCVVFFIFFLRKIVHKQFFQICNIFPESNQFCTVMRNIAKIRFQSFSPKKCENHLFFWLIISQNISSTKKFLYQNNFRGKKKKNQIEKKFNTICAFFSGFRESIRYFSSASSLAK